VIGAGQLRDRLTLQAPVETADGQGGVQRSYAAVRKVWAEVTPAAPRFSIEADVMGASARTRILVRSPLALSLQHRFVDGDGGVYVIVGYRDDGETIVIDADLRVV
jgi:head-tail adaptor